MPTKRIWWIIGFVILSAPVNAGEVRELPFKVLSTGIESRITHTAIYYVRDQHELQDLWVAHRGDDNDGPPKVDFDNNFVIAFFAGQRASSGYDVSIKRIIERPNRISLEIQESYPGANCVVLDFMTSPFQIVTIASRNGSGIFDFSLSRAPRDCL